MGARRAAALSRGRPGGAENAPGAFVGLLEGANSGKLLIRVEPDSTL